MRISYKQKLYTNKKNKREHKLIDLACEIHNFCIDIIRDYLGLGGKLPSKYDLQKIITHLKNNPRHEHWNQLGSQAIQDVTDRIYRGYQAFFKLRKKGKKASPPSYRKSEKYKSYTLKQAGYELLGGNKLRLGKNIYRFHNPREIEGVINTVTVKRDALGDIYVYFSCTLPDPQPKEVTSGKSVGFDFGLKTFLTGSDETVHISPQFFFNAMEELRRADRKLSSKEDESNNREWARLDKARIYKKNKNQRHDHFHKLAKELTQTYTVICIEDLNLAAMKKLWGRKISDLAFHSFVKILEHHCRKTGTKLIKIDRFYPSSKQCHECFVIKEDLTLKDREWTCGKCHTRHKRDLNAAKNIHRVGMSTLGLSHVRPTQLAIAV